MRLHFALLQQVCGVVQVDAHVPLLALADQLNLSCHNVPAHGSQTLQLGVRCGAVAG